MKKQTLTAGVKRLELKKTSIAKLNLTKAEMQVVVGGGHTTETENTSDVWGNDPNTNCTSLTHRETTLGLLTTLMTL
jgi:hypothetical protein